MAQAGFGEVAEALRRTTVQVSSGGRGFGSGVILGADGLIVTNAHVVRSSHAQVKLWDGRTLDAAVTSRDLARDLAALLASASGLPAATLADSSKARVGELVLAVGNPLGFVGALSTGIIHAAGSVHGLGMSSWLQADVKLAPGNSGGPLANAQGQVLGINTMVAGGLALAIPSNDLARFLANGPSHSVLGVEVRPVRMVVRDENRIGLLVMAVTPGGPANMASLMIGDILIGVESELFRSASDLQIALQGTAERILHLLFIRGDRRNIRRVAVRLGMARRVAA
ncbi:MAG TPA: trypsin-like peptidase domain-containing protein [Verrucomicrobiae bacterium]|jgi:serine protease Do|nr:trypsin-like peptidase domain-containing protein [Verrucomicrobiae bacterium]